MRFARVLASCGAKVALAARRVERLEAVADAIHSTGGQAAVLQVATDLVVPADVLVLGDEPA